MPSVRDRAVAEFAEAMYSGSAADQLYAYLKARTALPGTPSRADMMMEQFGRVFPYTLFHSSFDDGAKWAVLNGNSQLLKVAAPTLSGANAMKVTAINAAGTIGCHANIADYPEVTPRVTYGLRAFINSVAVQRQASVVLQWLDESKVGTTADNGSMVLSSVGSWTMLSGTATCPVGSVFLRPRVRILGTLLGEEHVVDDIIVYRAS